MNFLVLILLVNEFDVCNLRSECECVVVMCLLSFVNEVEFGCVIDKLKVSLFLLLIILRCVLLMLVDLAVFTLMVFKRKLGSVLLVGSFGFSL